jgi:predicted HicB family RNase H-like nuclease
MKKMNDVLTYKGFIGSVHFSATDNVFFGKVEGINDLVTFEGETVQELIKAFQYAVDEHIRDCERENLPAGKSYKGSFNVRLTPDLHRKIVVAAQAHGQSLNQYVSSILSRSILD